LMEETGGNSGCSPMWVNC